MDEEKVKEKMEDQINIRFESEEQIEWMCSLIKYCLNNKIKVKTSLLGTIEKSIIPEKDTAAYKQLLNLLQIQKFTNPLNQSEILKIQDLISSFGEKETSLLKAVDEIEKMEKERVNTLVVRLSDKWNIIIQDLKACIRGLKEGQNGIMRQYANILDRFDTIQKWVDRDIEERMMKDTKMNENDAQKHSMEQNELSEETDEENEPTEEQVEETKEEATEESEDTLGEDKSEEPQEVQQETEEEQEPKVEEQSEEPIDEATQTEELQEEPQLESRKEIIFS